MNNDKSKINSNDNTTSEKEEILNIEKDTNLETPVTDIEESIVPMLKESVELNNTSSKKKKLKKLRASFKDMCKSIKTSFKTKQNKHGSLVSATTIILLAIIIISNLALTKLDIKFDLTKNKIYSLTEDTNKLLKGLTNDINIITVQENGSENNDIKEILSKYESTSDKIKIKNIDPAVSPAAVKQFSKGGSEISSGSVIVESGNRFKVINEYDLYEIDYSTGQIKGIKAEQKLTSAIEYVTTHNLPKAYILGGHNEAELPSEIQDSLSNENYKTVDLNLFGGEEWKYEEEDILIVNSPQRDLSLDELGALQSYLSSGGKAFIAMGYVNETMPNFSTLLSHYGISIDNKLVIEGDNSMIYRLPSNIIPSYGNHNIVSPLITSGLPVLSPTSQYIRINDLTRSSLTIEPLLTTSNSAYAKSGLEINSFEKEDGDVDGPFNLAVAVTEKIENSNKSTELVVVSSSDILNSQSISLTKGGNLDFFMNSIGWLSQREDKITIRAKDISPDVITVNQGQVYTLALISMFIIPIFIITSGTIVWYKRRHL